MELTTNLTAEQVAFEEEKKLLTKISDELKDDTLHTDTFTNEEMYRKVEGLLQERIKKGEKQMMFSLGLLYLDQGMNKKAFDCFEKSKDFDYQSLYQYSVMLYDGIGVESDMKKALEHMIKLANCSAREARHLLPAARFNIGRAYFQAHGTPWLMEDEAVRWWLMAADDGNPKASIKAQSTLGMYYTRQGYSLDLSKAFFWHTEACGNGSLESQGALGVMYMQGLGVKKDVNGAYICLKNAADRGNVYAAANLVALLYDCKLFNKAADLAEKVIQVKDVDEVARQTDCLPSYVAKGVAMAYFYLGRLIQKGLYCASSCSDSGTVSRSSSGKSGSSRSSSKSRSIRLPPLVRARQLYSKCYRTDPGVCAKLYSLILKEAI